MSFKGGMVIIIVLCTTPVWINYSPLNTNLHSNPLLYLPSSYSIIRKFWKLSVTTMVVVSTSCHWSCFSEHVSIILQSLLSAYDIFFIDESRSRSCSGTAFYTSYLSIPYRLLIFQCFLFALLKSFFIKYLWSGSSFFFFNHLIHPYRMYLLCGSLVTLVSWATNRRTRLPKLHSHGLVSPKHSFAHLISAHFLNNWFAGNGNAAGNPFGTPYVLLSLQSSWASSYTLTY